MGTHHNITGKKSNLNIQRISTALEHTFQYEQHAPKLKHIYVSLISVVYA